MSKKQWSVYILECEDGSFYTGTTNDIKNRIKKHSTGMGSKYVKRKGFKKLLKIKKCKNQSEACKFEYTIKQLPRNKKLNWFD